MARPEARDVERAVLSELMMEPGLIGQMPAEAESLFYDPRNGLKNRRF